MRTKKSSERRFQSLESGANKVLFIRTSLKQPEAIVERIIGQITEEGEQKARYILRLVPVLGTCKAYDKNIAELASSVLGDVLTAAGSSPPTFCVLFKTRNNNQVKRDDTIKLIATGDSGLNR